MLYRPSQVLFEQSEETKFTLVHEAGGVNTVVNGIAADVAAVAVVMLGDVVLLLQHHG
jgi:hypothetical protein